MRFLVGDYNINFSMIFSSKDLVETKIVTKILGIELKFNLKLVS